MKEKTTIYQPSLEDKTKALGFIGVGRFASYTIAALRRNGFEGPVFLSPRNAKIAAELARNHKCEVQQSNEAVLDKAEIVVLSVPPQHVHSALEGLIFRESHLLVSAAAGVPLADLQRLSNAPGNIVRIMPVSCIEAGDGIVPLYPYLESAASFWQQAGTVVTFEDEKGFNLSTVASCMNGYFYALMEEMVRWMEEKGLPTETARDLIVHNIRGATAYASQEKGRSLKDIYSAIATDGTYTLTGLEKVRAENGIKPWTDSFEAIYQRMIGES